ncbi:MAG: RelA/SpoT family protein [Betaproteobacteria bacterium]|nr:RelA/SpoT family protein [Betaproteobacteria bacterium]
MTASHDIEPTQTSALDPEALIRHWREAGARIAPGEEAVLMRAIGVVAVAADPAPHDALGMADVIAGLHLDAETLTAALLLALPPEAPVLRDGALEWGDAIASLVEGARRMPEIHALLPDASGKKVADHAQQLERLRKMLLAMAQDARVVLLHLAAHLNRLRGLVKHGTAAQKAEIARETFDLLAPLANRLGVWQIKWELEDLAFRARDPDTYRAIARELDEKRVDRERFIAQVTSVLRGELSSAGLQAEVTGRPKHIYSIWKKMQRKDLGFKDLFDVRAVRILVDEVRECYTALGIVHNLWTPIPREFDDYIARPKANSYRSLHTAVIGPEDKVLEVQIRTHEMHQANELGIAAHWRYKEGGRRDVHFEERIAWLRQVLDWRLGGTDAGELADSFRTELFQDTVYVLTPQGRVIALPAGSTPVDFAYHVHTDLGHRCRGAKVNGQIVPLGHRLENGQRVEIIGAKEGGPSRDWLNPGLGFLQSHRARTKVRQWFNSQNLEQSIAQGRAVLDREIHRVGGAPISTEELASSLGYPRTEDLLAALGRGDVGPRVLQNALRARSDEARAEPAPEAELPSTDAVAPHGRSDGVLIVGVDRLLTQLARCCRPLPPDPIVGYVTRARGVSVHRSDCPNIRSLPADRRLDAAWGKLAPDARFPVDVEVTGETDGGLLRGVVDALGRERIKVRAARTAGRGHSERVRVSIDLTDGAALERVVTVLRALPGTSSVRRC